MFGMTATTEFDQKSLTDEMRDMRRRVLTHRAEELQAEVVKSFVVSDEPSAPGQPPHTSGRSGHSLPESIEIDVGEEDAVIGPSASEIGEVGRAHEFGESFRGEDFEARPFMQPVLMQNIDPFASDFSGSYGK